MFSEGNVVVVSNVKSNIPIPSSSSRPLVGIVIGHSPYRDWWWECRFFNIDHHETWYAFESEMKKV